MASFTRHAALEDQTHYITVSAQINVVCFVAQMLLFSCLLFHRRTSQMLAPRLRHEERAHPQCFAIGWVLEAWRHLADLDAQDVDGAMVVRFCILGLKVSAMGTVLSLGLVPLYAGGDGKQVGLNVWSLLNLRERSQFWWVVAAAYALVGCFFHFCASEWRHFIRLRKARLEQQAQGVAGPGAAQAQRSVIVENVPPSARSPDGSGVRAFFERMLPPASIHSCVLHPDTMALHGNPGALLRGAGRRRVQELRQALQLEPTPVEGTLLPLGSLRARLAAAAGMAPPTAGAAVGGEDEPAAPAEAARRERRCLQLLRKAWAPVGSTLASIHYRGGQALTLVKDVTIGSDGSQTAFVTFSSVSDRVVAEQLLLSHSGRWRASAAPEARDVIWHNTALTLRQLQARWTVAVICMVVGLGFWSVFVGSVQTYSDLDRMTAWEAVSAFKASHPKLYNFAKNYLPVLVLMGLQYALPYALWVGVLCYEKCKLKSDVMRRVLWRNLLYQCATLYVTVISRTISTNWSLKDQIGMAMQQTPNHILSKLSLEVPPVAYCFIVYVMTRIGVTLPLLLLCPVLSCGGTRPLHPDFGYEAANLGLVLVLGLTYSVIAPVIMPVCMVYFAFATLVYCWLFRFAYTPEFDSGGALWRELFAGVVIGLLFGTLSLAALVGTYAGWDSNAFLAMLLLAALVVFLFSVACHHFGNPSDFTSMEDACEVDKACDPDTIASLLRHDYYVDPVLKSLGGGTHVVEGTVESLAGVAEAPPAPPLADPSLKEEQV